jgi:hypothetical protein
MRADLDHGAADHDAIAQRAPGHSSGGDARSGFAGRGASAAAIVPHAIFGVIGIVGMAGPVAVADLAIVLRALVGVLDHQRDGRAGRHRAAKYFKCPVVLEDAGEDLHRVRLLALRDEARGAGAAFVQELLDEGFIQRQAGRAAIDHTSEGRPVAFAPGRHTEEVAERVVRHGCP